MTANILYAAYQPVVQFLQGPTTDESARTILTFYRESCRKNPVMENHLCLGLIYQLYYREYQSALECYDKVIMRNGFELFLKFACRTRLMLKSIDIFEKISSSQDHVDYSVVHFGEYLFNETMLSLYPDACFIKGLIRQYQGNHLQTKNLYERALELNNDDFAIHNNLADLCSDYLQDYDLSREHYLAAIRINPRSDVSHNNLANLLKVHFEEYEKAREHYEAELQICPDAIGHLNMADLLANYLNQPENARTHFELSLRYESRDVSCLLQYAYLLEDKFGDYWGAIDLVERSLKIDPHNCVALNCLGSLYEVLDEFEKAIRCFKTVLAIDPSQFQAHYQLGNIYEQYQNYDKAREHYLAALQISPDFLVRYHLSELYQYKYKDYKAAQEQLRQSMMELKPSMMQYDEIATRIFCKLTQLFHDARSFFGSEFGDWFHYFTIVETESSVSQHFNKFKDDVDELCIQWHKMPDVFRSRLQYNFKEKHDEIIEKFQVRQKELKDSVEEAFRSNPGMCHLSEMIVGFTNYTEYYYTRTEGGEQIEYYWD